MRPSAVRGFGIVVYRWMLDRGYMIDPADGDLIAERVHDWDVQDLIDRLRADDIVISEGGVSEQRPAMIPDHP